ncbi:MAG: hypothetical protein IJC49_06985 [Clostridia bacterium]|nr:hypothetical protein [Clostridia bacterium]
MKEKTYKRILWALVAVGIAITVAHVAYAVYAYGTSSIIHYVSKEWW